MMNRTGSSLARFLAASASATFCAGLSFAQSGAPIVYKTPDAPQASVGAGQGGTPVSAQPARAASSDRPRIEFRYPDQPDLVYSQNGIRPVDGDAPMAFSSSTSAISAQEARQYASVEPPMAARQPAALDPAITPGGFDARATAERIAAQAALPPHRGQAPSPAANAYSRPGTPVRPASVAQFEETGLAGLYEAGFDGTQTANGEIYDAGRLSAAHPSLPIPSLVQVTNPSNGREIVVRVNDRGPFEEGRIIDLSQRAGDLLGFGAAGTSNVQVRYLGPAPVEPMPAVQTAGSDTVDEFSLPEIEVAATARPAVATPDRPLQSVRQYSASTTGYFVQVGSFSNIANAQRLSASLDASLFVEVVPVRLNGADFFRVLVGPYRDKGQAEIIRQDLHFRGVASGLVVSKP